jgi:hypothetical protein
MRFADLNPLWVNDVDGVRIGVGVEFDCPRGCPHRLMIFFANPIDGGPPLDSTYHPAYRFNRLSEDLIGLTIMPAVHWKDVTGWDQENMDDESKWVWTTHWLGFIRQGEVW